MNTISFLVGLVLPYFALTVFIVSILLRIYRWLTTPHLLKWSLYPMPQNSLGQIGFMLKEILSFKSVFHNNRKLWAGGWIFHIGMALIAFWFVTFILGFHWGTLLRIGLVILIVMPAYIMLLRTLNRNMRAISSPLEYFNLFIFMATGILGIYMITYARPDPEIVRNYFSGMLSLHPVLPPASSAFLGMLAITEFFLIYFPNSRMLHMVSKYFTFHKVSWEKHEY